MFRDGPGVDRRRHVFDVSRGISIRYGWARVSLTRVRRSEEFTTAAAANGIRIVATERYARSDTAVTAQTLKLISARPDAMLIAGAGKDRICISAKAKAFAARAPQGEYVEIAEAEHEILMERSLIRARFWAAFDAFTGRQPA